MTGSSGIDQRLLYISVYAALINLFFDIPIQFTVAIIFLLIWHLFVILGWTNSVSKKTCNFLVFCLILICIISYRNLSEKEIFPAFLASLCSIKLLDAKKQKDYQFLSLLTFFLISFKFLFSIDIVVTFINIIITAFLWLSLYPVTSERKAHLGWRISLLGKAYIFVIPLSIAIYALFPRIHPFWLNMKVNSEKGSVGFSDKFSPGSIASIAQSNELVFRVELLNGAQVSEQDLYWRGLILDKTDGFSWQKTKNFENDESYISAGKILEYRMVVEPSHESLLFPLDVPIKLRSNELLIVKKKDGSIHTSDVINSRSVISGQSFWDIKRKPKNMQAYLQLPKLSTEVQKLVQSLKSSNSKKETVKNILNYFQKKNFLYSLSPGKMDETNIDEFLFKKRIGFCEHYSSAFAILARAAGIPARVIIGYQGAEYNSIGNFYSVTKKFAHAWNEYVDDGGNWIRIDPVEYVAPSRINLGAERFSELPELLQNIGLKDSRGNDGLDFVLDFVSTGIQSLNYNWNKWLINFDLDRQKELIALLPITFGGFFILLIFSLSFLIWGPKLIKNIFSNSQYVTSSYLYLLKWSSQHGLPKEGFEGPFSFAHRIIQTWPEKEGFISNIVEMYVQQEYLGNKIDSNSLKQLAKSIKYLKSKAPVEKNLQGRVPH